MTTTKPITVFVCGLTLRGEVLKGLTVQNGAVIWENGTEPAPAPIEPIRAIHHLPLADRIMLVETEVGLYLTTVDDLIGQPFSFTSVSGRKQPNCLSCATSATHTNDGPDDPDDPDEPIMDVVHIRHHDGLVLIVTNRSLYLVDLATVDRLVEAAGA